MPSHFDLLAGPHDHLIRWIDRGRPEEDTRDMCIKLFELKDDDFLRGLEKDNEVLREVEKEVRLLSSIKHPNVVEYKGRASKGEEETDRVLSYYATRSISAG
jgi:hypothetical protein